MKKPLYPDKGKEVFLFCGVKREERIMSGTVLVNGTSGGSVGVGSSGAGKNGESPGANGARVSHTAPAPATLATYREFVNTVGRLWPMREEPAQAQNSTATDFWRVQHGKTPEHGDRAYLMFNPEAVDPLDLTDSDFDTLRQRVGDDVWRMRAVPPAILKPDEVILPTGGSCAIETAGVRVCQWMKGRVGHADAEKAITEQEMAKRVDVLLESAPTVSHVSGGMLTGASHAVHFVEDGLWTSTVEQLGVSDASKKVKAAYDRIGKALERRAELVNPEATMDFVSFEELDLPTAVGDWMQEVGITPGENFGLAEVMYTYMGPKILDLTRDALRKQYTSSEGREMPLEVANATRATRLKQMDHNTLASMDLPLGHVLRGESLTEEQAARAEEEYPYRACIAIAKDRKQSAENNPAQVGGFMDLPYGETILHMTPELGRKSAGNEGAASSDFLVAVDSILEDPKRLTARNIESHYRMLKHLVDPQLAETRKSLGVQKGTILGEMKKPAHSLKKLLTERTQRKDRVSKLKESIQFADAENRVLFAIIGGEEIEFSNPDVLAAISRLKEQTDSLIGSIREREIGLSAGEVLSELDAADLRDANHFLNVLDSMESSSVIPSQYAKDAEPLIRKYQGKKSKGIERDGQIVAEHEARLGVIMSEASKLDEELKPGREKLYELERQMSELPSPTPLTENPLVIHALQFTFDPNFRAFLTDVAELQDELKLKVPKPIKTKGGGDPSPEVLERQAEIESITTRKEVAQESLRNASEQILPRVISYYDYIYGRTDDYPEMRFECDYQQVCAM